MVKHVYIIMACLQDLRIVQQYEQEVGGIQLDPTTARDNTMYFSPRSPHTVSSRYAAAYESKAHLIMRMLEMHIGQELLIQVKYLFLT